STGVTSTTSANIGGEWQANIGLNLNTPIGEKFNIGFSPLIRYNRVQNTASPLQERKGISGNAFTNFQYRVTGKFTISGSAGFLHVPYTLINTQSTQYFYQVNFGYKFFKEKLSTTINFNNFFEKNMNYHTVTLDPDFRVESTSINPYRVIYFGMTYNFGKLKESTSKKKGVNNDDLL
ncbi:MAG: outer membrane beta-barrel protein, partial [Sediminibacterium sp.]